MEKKTPLYDVHVEEGGKIVPFAGYLLPVQYETGVIVEHNAVRKTAGLFDVSHMGEVVVSGPGALASLNHLMTNDFTNMKPGRVRYSVMCHENGGSIDDLIVYKFGEESYLVVVNAANRDKDVNHIKSNLLADTKATDISDSIAQLALQGPASDAILAKLADKAIFPTDYYTAVAHVDVDGIDCMVSRTGYTGEAGFELYTAAENGPALWKKLRLAGADLGLIPCGLGARDTLRLEAGMPLYGHELTDDISPMQAGLTFAVALDHDFIGRDALALEGEPEQVRVGLEVTGRGIVREHQDVYAGDAKIGISTSGTMCPFVGKALAMAYIDRAYSEVGTDLEVDVRGRRVPVRVVPLPFYSRTK